MSAPQGSAIGEGVGARPLRARGFVRSRLSGIIIAYAALMLATGWGYSSLRIRTDHEQTLELERNRLRTVAAALQTGVQAMLDDGVGAAIGAANASAGRIGTEPNDAERAEALAKMLETRGDIRSLFIWSAGHYVRVGREGKRDTAAVAPDWLWTPGSTASGTNWVGRTMRDPEQPGVLVLPVARYFAMPGGGVWAGAFFEFRAFDDLYARLGERLRVMALIASNGSLLIRIPLLKGIDPAAGINVGGSDVFLRAMETPGAAVVEGNGPLVNEPMIFGYERVHGYEMFLTVGQARDVVLAPWEERRITTLWVTVAYSVLVIFMTALLSYYLRARKEAERTLRESEGRYRSLVDALPEAVFVHRGNDMLFLNQAGMRLIGATSQNDLAGRPVLGFMAEGDRAMFAARMKRIMEQNESVPPVEVRIHRLNGVPLWVEVQGVPIEFAGKPAVQSVLHDVTARHRQKQADDARAARIQLQSHMLLRLASREGRRPGGLQSALGELCAQACETVLAKRATVWIRRDQQFVPVSQYGYAGEPVPLVAEAASKVYSAALSRERIIEATEARDDPRTATLYSSGVIHPDTRSVLAAAIRRSGDLCGAIAFEWSGEPRTWYSDELSFVCGVADQVAQVLIDSEREQALADLRALTGELMRLQDEERRRIGRDLHDSTGQTLAALEISLARLANASSNLSSDERRELLLQCVDLATLCSTEIRTASYLLHPPLLDELGLLSALKWLADGLRERSGIEVRLEQPESMVRLTREEELTLFRVAQEALTNVHRHAASPWASIRLSVRPESVLLEIRDAGRGIRSAHTGDSAFTLGVGLAGMRERIRQVGGTFAVEGAGTGTLVRVTLPIERRERREGAHA